MKLKYTGPATDHSGYGEANRHDIGALVAARVQVTTELPRYVTDVSDCGELGRLAVGLENSLPGYSFKIIHSTPDQFGHFREADKFNIARVFWETDRLPEEFADEITKAQEIWTGSEFNAQAIRNAGVTVPIHIIPEAIDTKLTRPKGYKTAASGYRFYSIFEWSERKNPLALLEAYWREFEGREDVSLSLKTYDTNFSQNKKDEIRNQIRRFKSNLGLTHYAPVYLYKDLMDKAQVYRFHASFDCFVSAHRGEGWGIPQMEAMLLGNPIISTNLGGIHEYLSDKTALLVNYQMEPVQDLHRKWYKPNQNWAAVDMDDLRAKLRFAYGHPKEMKKLTLAGQKLVKQQFSLEAVGEQMRDRLAELEPLTWETQQ